MPWDANITTSQFKGKLPLRSFNQLQAAIKERCLASGTAVPAMFNSDMAKMELLPKTWFSTFQTTMTTLISGPYYGGFINHLDNSGNWNNQSSIPAWTEATILTATGDASRLPAPASFKCSEWAYQQYKFLNLLKWVKGGAYKYSTEFRGGLGSTYTLALSAYNSSTWSPFSASSAMSVYNPGASPKALGVYRTANVIPAISTTIQASMDVYFYFSGIGINYYSADGYQPDKWTKFFTYPEALVNSNKITAVIELGVCADFPVYSGCMNNQPGAPLGSGYGAVLKFDGANGLKFKDW